MLRDDNNRTDGRRLPIRRDIRRHAFWSIVRRTATTRGGLLTPLPLDPEIEGKRRGSRVRGQTAVADSGKRIESEIGMDPRRIDATP